MTSIGDRGKREVRRAKKLGMVLCPTCRLPLWFHGETRREFAARWEFFMHRRLTDDPAFIYHRQATVDHIIPRSRGGSDHRKNLMVMCADCNSSKGEMDLFEFVRKNGKRLHLTDVEFGKLCSINSDAWSHHMKEKDT